jgi:hypothetical protein
MSRKSNILNLLLLFVTLTVSGQGTINNRPGGGYEQPGPTPGGGMAPAATLPSEQTYESVKSSSPSTAYYGQYLSMDGSGSTPPGGGSIGSTVPVGSAPIASLLILGVCYILVRKIRTRKAV